jgi:hypothetical protein
MFKDRVVFLGNKTIIRKCGRQSTINLQLGDFVGLGMVSGSARPARAVEFLPEDISGGSGSLHGGV